MIGLQIDELRSLIDYDPNNGVFVWRNGKREGTVAGSYTAKGYRQIYVAGATHLAHRLAWFWVHGRWPNGQIDHKNQDKADNRIDNLREASNSQNMANTGLRTSNRSGFKGVSYFRPANLWRWRLGNGDIMRSGYARTPEAAHKAYVRASKEVNGEFSRTA